jgi:hypothetical protein
MEEESALKKSLSEFRFPKPISENEIRDIEQALMGDYKDHYQRSKGNIIVLPEAKLFEERLENSKIDNLSIDSPARRYRFLVPFVIKSELSPGLAFGEGLLSWIHFLSRK